MTSDALSQRQRASALLEMRRPAEARAILEPLLVSDPHDAKATVLLASCWQQEDDPRRALELCRSAASLAPEDAVVLPDCASVARVSGHLDAARAWTGEGLPGAFLPTLYGLVIAIGTAGRRTQVDRELRRRGVELPS